ncbi:MAG: hypothetical protein SGPRY_010749 [Prymnesium sp.]
MGAAPSAALVGSGEEAVDLTQMHTHVAEMERIVVVDSSADSPPLSAPEVSSVDGKGEESEGAERGDVPIESVAQGGAAEVATPVRRGDSNELSPMTTEAERAVEVADDEAGLDAQRSAVLESQSDVTASSPYASGCEAVHAVVVDAQHDATLDANDTSVVAPLYYAVIEAPADTADSASCNSVLTTSAAEAPFISVPEAPELDSFVGAHHMPLSKASHNAMVAARHDAGLVSPAGALLSSPDISLLEAHDSAALSSSNTAVLEAQNDAVDAAPYSALGKWYYVVQKAQLRSQAQAMAVSGRHGAQDTFSLRASGVEESPLEEKSLPMEVAHSAALQQASAEAVEEEDAALPRVLPTNEAHAEWITHMGEVESPSDSPPMHVDVSSAAQEIQQVLREVSMGRASIRVDGRSDEFTPSPSDAAEGKLSNSIDLSESQVRLLEAKEAIEELNDLDDLEIGRLSSLPMEHSYLKSDSGEESSLLAVKVAVPSVLEVGDTRQELAYFLPDDLAFSPQPLPGSSDTAAQLSHRGSHEFHPGSVLSPATLPAGRLWSSETLFAHPPPRALQLEPHDPLPADTEFVYAGHAPRPTRSRFAFRGALICLILAYLLATFCSWEAASALWHHSVDWSTGPAAFGEKKERAGASPGISSRSEADVTRPGVATIDETPEAMHASFFSTSASYYSREAAELLWQLADWTVEKSSSLFDFFYVDDSTTQSETKPQKKRSTSFFNRDSFGMATNDENSKATYASSFSASASHYSHEAAELFWQLVDWSVVQSSSLLHFSNVDDSTKSNANQKKSHSASSDSSASETIDEMTEFTLASFSASASHYSREAAELFWQLVDWSVAQSSSLLHFTNVDDSTTKNTIQKKTRSASSDSSASETIDEMPEFTLASSFSASAFHFWGEAVELFWQLVDWSVEQSSSLFQFADVDDSTKSAGMPHEIPSPSFLDSDSNATNAEHI